MTATPHYGAWGFDLAGRDTTVKPGDDFFRYANGTYLKTTEIPSDRSRFGNFDALSILSENRVHAILQEAAAKPGAPGAPRAKIGAYYRAYMDEGRVNALGAKPLAADLARIKAADSHEAVAALMGRHDGFFDSIFGGFVGPDAKSPKRVCGEHGHRGPRPARQGLLPEARLRQAARGLSGLHRPDADAGRLARRHRPRGRRDRLRDQARRSLVGPRAAARPRQDLQPHHARRASGHGARLRLQALPRRGGPGRRDQAGLDRQHRLRPQGQDLRRDARGGAAGVDGVQPGRQLGALSFRPVRAGAVRLQEQAPERPARTRRTLEARGGGHQRRPGRGDGRSLRAALFHARGQGADAGPREQHQGGAEPPHPEPGVDDAGDQAGGAAEALQIHREDRLSRQVARLFGAGRLRHRSLWRRQAFARVRVELSHGAACTRRWTRRSGA